MNTLARKDVDSDQLSVLREAIGRLPKDSALATALNNLRESLDDGVDVLVSALDEELSPNQAAQYLNVSRPTVYKIIESNDLPARRVGTHYRIRMRDLLGYAKRHRAAQAELAETFAHADANERKLLRERAGVDEETAERLGY